MKTYSLLLVSLLLLILTGSCQRVIRGGSEGSRNSDVRIISAWDYPADGTASDLGFRLVMSAND